MMTTQQSPTSTKDTTSRRDLLERRRRPVALAIRGARRLLPTYCVGWEYWDGKCWDTIF